VAPGGRFEGKIDPLARRPGERADQEDAGARKVLGTARNRPPPFMENRGNCGVESITAARELTRMPAHATSPRALRPLFAASGENLAIVVHRS
jgi:hypothetical protein